MNNIFNLLIYVCLFLDMKRFNDGHSSAPFKRPKMGPDDIELRVLIPSKVFKFDEFFYIIYFSIYKLLVI